MRFGNDGGDDGGNVGAYIELVSSAVENGFASDFLRGEGGMDIQLTVLDEKILVK